MTDSENKSHKFKFEVEDWLVYEDGRHGHRYSYTGYGDTAEEAIDNQEKLVKEWSTRCEKSLKEPIKNRKDLT